ncbi:MAG: hypothetical protein AAGK78_07515, partial [Planctomycetota bacterium]
MFDHAQRPVVLQQLREAASFRDITIAAIAVGDVHAHLLLQHQGDYAAVKKVAGGLKTGSSYLLRDILPGQIWSKSTSPKPIKDASHLRNTFFYIRDKQEPCAATWGDLTLLSPNPTLPRRRQDTSDTSNARDARDARDAR